MALCSGSREPPVYCDGLDYSLSIAKILYSHIDYLYCDKYLCESFVVSSVGCVPNLDHKTGYVKIKRYTEDIWINNWQIIVL